MTPFAAWRRHYRPHISIAEVRLIMALERKGVEYYRLPFD